MAKNFEEFLQNWHAKDYIGTDDDMVDAYELWLGALEVDSFLTLADTYGQEKLMEGFDRAAKAAVEALKPSVEALEPAHGPESRCPIDDCRQCHEISISI